MKMTKMKISSMWLVLNFMLVGFLDSCSSSEEAPAEEVVAEGEQTAADDATAASESTATSDAVAAEDSAQAEDVTTSDAAPDTVEAEPASVDAAPSEEMIAPVQEEVAAPSEQEPVPVNYTVEAGEGRVLRYVRKDQTKSHKSASASSTTASNYNRGDVVMVVYEGGFAKLDNGTYIDAKMLSAKGLGRVKRPVAWAKSK